MFFRLFTAVKAIAVISIIFKYLRYFDIKGNSSEAMLLNNIPIMIPKKLNSNVSEYIKIFILVKNHSIIKFFRL